MNKIVKVYLNIVLGLFPVAFMPLFTDIYGYGKIWLWMALAMIGVILWGVTKIIGWGEKMKVDGVLAVLAGMLVWSIVSWLREELGVRERSFYSVSGVGMIGASMMWYFLALQLKSRESWWKVLRIPGVIMAVTSLAVFLVPESKLPISWPENFPIVSIGSGWSLAGGALAEALFLLVVGIMNAKVVMDKLKKGENYIVDAVVTAVIGLGMFLDIYRIFKMGWGVMDMNTAWSIAAESFKRSPLWGAGVGNFYEAFNLYRPASYNLTKLWSVSMSQSSMVWLQLWTELGIVGLAASVLLVLQMLKREAGFEKWLGLGALVAAMLLPFNTMSWWLIVVGVALSAKGKEVALRLPVGDSEFNLMPILAGLVALLLAGYGSFALGKNVVAETMIKNSLVAAAKNDGGMAYDWQRRAVGVQPNMADYRKSYSLTNLAIAQTLLADENISDENKEKVSVLLQQAVREGKAAVSLDTMNANYWANLAGIYKAMIGLVDGSADWSVQAYQQAIVLDPVNPLLQIDYGGLLYAAGSYEAADRVFEQVVVNKQDYANAWYNWAYTAKQLNKIYEAVQRLNQAVALVPADSGDYEAAKKELDTWTAEYDELVKKQEEAQKAAQAQQQTNTEEKQPESLTVPEPLPTVGEEEKVNVPAEELEPPVVSPMPTSAAETTPNEVNPETGM